jgi:hypothetical protein
MGFMIKLWASRSSMGFTIKLLDIKIKYKWASRSRYEHQGHGSEVKKKAVEEERGIK